MFLKYIIFFVGVLLLQAEARSTAHHEKSSEVTSKNSNPIANLLKDSQSLYTGIQAISTLAELGKWPHIDPEACINITVDVASFEQEAYTAYKFGLFLYSASLSVGKDVWKCSSHLPNGFELLKCAISRMADTEPVMEVVWQQLYDLVDQTETNYNQIVKDIFKCIGKSQNTLSLH